MSIVEQELFRFTLVHLRFSRWYLQIQIYVSLAYLGYPVEVSLSPRLKLFGSPIRWLCGRPINGPSEPHSAHEISAHQNFAM